MPELLKAFIQSVPSILKDEVYVFIVLVQNIVLSTVNKAYVLGCSKIWTRDASIFRPIITIIR